MLFVEHGPIEEFLRWFNLNYDETPPVAIKFTHLTDGQGSHYDHKTWTIWIDIRLAYQDIIDRIGREASSVLASLRGVDDEIIYREIRDRWAAYVSQSASDRESIIRRKLT